MPNQAKNTNTSHRLHISNVVEANYHVAQYHVPNDAFALWLPVWCAYDLHINWYTKHRTHIIFHLIVLCEA